ncbi:MAG TPA: TolC family protein, partial [Rhodocyclaceae bacterium]|nr:TolC family protein [Rhodocyclaceae bacterium]
MNPPVPGRYRTRGLLAALALGCLLATGGLRAESTGLGADVASLLDYARSANPMFAVERAEAEAARARIGAAGGLPDPSFQLELMDATNTMSGRSASLLPGQVGETRYRITQPLPGWGKRELAVKAAEAQATQADAMRDTSWA